MQKINSELKIALKACPSCRIIIFDTLISFFVALRPHGKFRFRTVDRFKVNAKHGVSMAWNRGGDLEASSEAHAVDKEFTN